VNLGLLPGDNGSMAFAVSESGSVVGVSSFESISTEPSYAPVYWYFNGQAWDIYALPKGASDGENGFAFEIAGPVSAVEYVVGAVGSKAVIWTVTGHTSFSGPELLDQDAACTWSVAYAVNVDGVAAGKCDNQAAIWSPGQAGYDTSRLTLPVNGYAEARDVNDDGVVVGHNCDSNIENCSAFVLKSGSSTVIQLHDQINGDPESYAAAVSDVVMVNGRSVVYVTGSTTSADYLETGTRWTVPVSILEGPSSDAVTQVALTKQWCSGVNNAGDAVCTSSGGGRQSTALVRDGLANSLKPPKRGTDAASFDLARADELPTYAVGVAQADGLRATVWVINK
jgi:hypothetical protein